MHKRKPSTQYNNHRPTKYIPPQKNLEPQWFWIIGGMIGLGLFFWLLKPVFALLAASAGIAYVCHPLILRLERHSLNRDQSIMMLIAIGVGVLLLFLLVILPPVVIQMDNLSQDLEQMIHNIEDTTQQLQSTLAERFGWSISFDLEFLKEKIPEWSANISSDWQQKGLDLGKGLLLKGVGFVSAILNLLLLPVFTYYLLYDWEVLLERIHTLIPQRFQGMVSETMIEVDERLNAFVIGQIKVCFALAILYSVGLLLVGIDLALPIGLLSGLLFVIPYVGTVFGIVSASVLALINFGVDWHIIGVLAVFGVSQMIEGYYLTPKIIGDSVGLSPMVVMIALIVGASLMGIWGMFLAIPVTAVLSVFTQEWLDGYQQSKLYLNKHDT